MWPYLEIFHTASVVPDEENMHHILLILVKLRLNSIQVCFHMKYFPVSNEIALLCVASFENNKEYTNLCHRKLTIITSCLCLCNARGLLNRIFQTIKATLRVRFRFAFCHEFKHPLSYIRPLINYHSIYTYMILDKQGTTKLQCGIGHVMTF